MYKEQGRIRGELMTRPYEAFRVREEQLQSSIPTEPASTAFGGTSRSHVRARSGRHCMTCATQGVWGHHRPAIAVASSGLRNVPRRPACLPEFRVGAATRGTRYRAPPSSDGRGRDSRAGRLRSLTELTRQVTSRAAAAMHHPHAHRPRHSGGASSRASVLVGFRASSPIEPHNPGLMVLFRQFL